MDTGAGGVKDGAGGGFVLRQLEIRRSPFAPGTFAGVELGIADGGRRAGLLLYPAEARQLAAALVALADEIAPRPWDADPLKLAIAVIEGYQMEIRNSGGDYGINLAEAGFCQGSIYVDAVERIRKLAQEQP